MSLQIEQPADSRQCRVDMALPTMQDIEYLCENMRQADRDETLASCGLDPVNVVREALRISTYAVTLRFNDEVVGLFGLRPLTQEWGVPWALGTDVARKFPHHFVSVSTGILRGMLKECSVLVNLMDARNEDGLRWARLVGFEIRSPVPHGPYDFPFHPIVMRRVIHV
jgi:hypothetical protein